MTPEQKEQCSQILNHFGHAAQTNKAVEELEELRDAIVEQDHTNVIEEIADVKIMLEQLELMLGCQEVVTSTISRKLDRTRSRIVTGFYNEAVATTVTLPGVE